MTNPSLYCQYHTHLGIGASLSFARPGGKIGVREMPEVTCPKRNVIRKSVGYASPISSWPGSIRGPSAYEGRSVAPRGGGSKGVDARIKSAQDDLRSFSGGPTRDSPARKRASRA